jgi:hypothetical protein
MPPTGVFAAQCPTGQRAVGHDRVGAMNRSVSAIGEEDPQALGSDVTFSIMRRSGTRDAASERSWRTGNRRRGKERSDDWGEDQSSQHPRIVPRTRACGERPVLIFAADEEST